MASFKVLGRLKLMNVKFFEFLKSRYTKIKHFTTKMKVVKVVKLRGVHNTPTVGCFFKMFKIQLLCCFITQLVKKLQQWSLYEVIEDILPIVLNTKQPLSY